MAVSKSLWHEALLYVKSRSIVHINTKLLGVASFRVAVVKGLEWRRSSRGSNIEAGVVERAGNTFLEAWIKNTRTAW